MKLLSIIKRHARKSVMLGVLAGAVFGVSVFTANPAPAQAASSFDCNANAVVWCGASDASVLDSKYDNGDGHNSAASIHNIYDSSSFGISSADISAMKSDAVSGSVSKSGNVYVGSELVATNALTAGRENIKGSTKETNNGTTFYTRTPSVSFLDSSLSAMVVMKNGVFQFAILNSCGNPVVAHPKKPNYTITKLVSVKGQGDFKNNITVTPGTHVEYKITVSSTGAVPAKNITVNDVLPKGVTEVANTLTRNDPGSAPAVNGNDKAFFSNGVNIASLAPGNSVVFEFEAIVGSKDKDTLPNCTNETLNNEGYINAPGLPKEHNGAIVNTKCLPKPPTPVFACTNLTDTPSKNDASTYSFTASSSVKNGAKVTGYSFAFGDGTTKQVNSTATTATISHTYAAPGTYNAVVTAIFDVNGVTKTDTSNECSVTIKIKKPVTPVLACTSLDGVADSRTKYTFNSAATATGGATITGYTYNFGDGTSKTNASSSATDSVNHTYTAPGTYTITVTVSGMLNGKATTVTNANCQTQVTVLPAPAAECTGLTATQSSDDQFTFTAAAAFTAANGASLTASSFDWGDQTAATPGTVSGNTVTAGPHTYAAAGTYTITATLSFSSTGAAIPNSTCSAVVTINAPQAAYTCDALTISQGDDRTVTITGLQTTATNGAVFSSADINWGDNSDVTGLSDVTGQTHQYAADGTYTITAVAHFTVDNQDVTASSTGCSQQVTFTTPPPVTPPTTPTPPSALVNTGAGNVIGLFAAAVAIGTLGYRWFLGRKLSRDS